MLRENKNNPNDNISIDSSYITLNDSLMYFKEEKIKL